MSDGRLMQLFAEFTAWQNYAATQLADAEVTEERAEANLKRLTAQGLIMTPPGQKVTVTQAKAGIAMSPEVERAEQDRLNAYAQRKMLKVVYDNCERSVFVVSRELSRRIGNAGTERRQMRWNP